MKTSVRAIQCRVETNVADRPCRILWPLMLAVALDIFHRTTQNGHWKVKIITTVEGT